MDAFTQLLAEKVALLETRVGILERFDDGHEQFQSDEVTGNTRRLAAFMALRSIVNDLSTRLGLSWDRTEAVFQARTNFYLDRLFRESEDLNPECAARLDDRTEEEIPVDSGFPQLFE